MNMAAFERALVANFAYREARETGSLDCMRAVCYVLRNRVKSGWGDGSYLSVLAASAKVSAHDRQPGGISIGDRLLQLIVRDIDDIYLSQDHFEDSVRDIVVTDDRKRPSLYYAFVNRPVLPWFAENIIRQSQDHQHVGNIGAMMLYR